MLGVCAMFLVAFGGLSHAQGLWGLTQCHFMREQHLMWGCDMVVPDFGDLGNAFAPEPTLRAYLECFPT